jgi:predicted kinase
MIAPPGAGKTTLSNLYIAKGYTSISADKVREDLFGDASMQGKSEVWREFYKRLSDAVDDRKNIVIDNTNTSAKDRKKLLDKLTGYEVEYIVFTVPLWLCLQRNAKRKRQVPEDAIERKWLTLKNNLPLIYTECANILFTEQDGTINEERIS